MKRKNQNQNFISTKKNSTNEKTKPHRLLGRLLAAVLLVILFTSESSFAFSNTTNWTSDCILSGKTTWTTGNAGWRHCSDLDFIPWLSSTDRVLLRQELVELAASGYVSSEYLDLALEELQLLIEQDSLAKKEE